MAIATINWIPGGGGASLSQVIHYRAMGDISWTLYTTVDASTATAEIVGLDSNVVYQFRITNDCDVIEDSFSNIVEGIVISCPTVEVDTTPTTATFTFAHLGGDIVSYRVELLNSSNVFITEVTIESPGSMVTDTFSSLSQNTTYKIRITPFATGDQGTYSEVCGSVSFVTNLCNGPTGVSAVMS